MIDWQRVQAFVWYHQPELSLFTFAMLLYAVQWGLNRRRRRQPVDLLETALLHWTRHDPFTVRDLLNGGVAILGRAGSGKTSSSGTELARAIVSLPRSGGLILAAKPEDLAMWRQLFAEARRSDDLLVFAPDHPLRCNFLECELRADGQTRNLVQFLRTVGETVQRQNHRGGSDRDSFFEEQEDRLLYNAVEIVKQATGNVTAPDLQQFIIGAAQSPDQLRSPEWRTGFHCQLLEAAGRAAVTPADQHDFALAADFWLAEFPALAERTRSSILAGVMGTLHVYNTGLVRPLVSQETNVRPADMLAGKWLLVDMPPAQYGAAGSLIGAGFKYLAQRTVLRRAAEPTHEIHVIWCDEAQQFVNSFDAQYIAQCRSHRGCLVYLSQSLPGYYSAFHGESAEHQAHALLANFTHTVVHAVDPVTAEWASKKLGRRRETFFSGSMAPATDLFDQLFGPSRTTSSFSEQYEPVLQEQAFMHGLRTGGPANGRVCDAIVIRSGEPFSSGENYLFRTFSQESVPCRNKSPIPVAIFGSR